MLLKGAAFLAAAACMSAATAQHFDVRVISTSGDFQFSATATYWAGDVNQIRPSFWLDNASPNTRLTATVISEATARDNWWFTAQNFLTFDGQVFWNLPSNPDSRVRITSLIQDLDNGRSYTMVSNLDRNGSTWDRDAVFDFPTKRIRWTDTIELINGSTGTLSRWQSTNHTMRMIWDPVPEPSSAAALLALLGIVLARPRKRT